MVISSEILRGHTETITLNILIKGDSYGYDITKQIHSQSEGLVNIKDATIYTALSRMEKEELITTYWGEGVGGARRKYYSITPSGKKKYKELVDDWKITVKVLNKLIGGDNND